MPESQVTTDQNLIRLKYLFDMWVVIGYFIIGFIPTSVVLLGIAASECPKDGAFENRCLDPFFMVCAGSVLLNITIHGLFSALENLFFKSNNNEMLQYIHHDFDNLLHKYRNSIYDKVKIEINFRNPRKPWLVSTKSYDIEQIARFFGSTKTLKLLNFCYSDDMNHFFEALKCILTASTFVFNNGRKSKTGIPRELLCKILSYLSIDKDILLPTLKVRQGAHALLTTIQSRHKWSFTNPQAVLNAYSLYLEERQQPERSNTAIDPESLLPNTANARTPLLR